MANSLANLIIEKLKTSSIYNGDENNPNIILFSDADVFPDCPCVVVKPEVGISQNTRSFRIIARMEKGNFDKLEDYVLKELDSFLLADYLTDEEGGRFKLYPGGYTDITLEKEDNTFFMERIYYTPMPIKIS
jgi:hypothetical protein